MPAFSADFEVIMSHIKRQEKQLVCKRRWLMGLPASKSEERHLKGPMFLQDRCLPESLLREDDVFYETVKTCVGKGFGMCRFGRVQNEVQSSMQLFSSCNIADLSSLLNDLSCKGLYHFANIITGGAPKCEKTRWKMKKLIKESLSRTLKDDGYNFHQRDTFAQLCQLLSDKNNFRNNCTTLWPTATQPPHAAVTKILDGLEDMPIQMLRAMHRKLKGICVGKPKFQPHRSGWTRDCLVNRVRKKCLKMLSKLGEGDTLQEPLAKAMTVANLSLKLALGNYNAFETEFQHCLPEIRVLQNEIMKAIRLLNKNVKSSELTALKLILDPSAEVSMRSLRTAIKSLLTEYLFECSDMDFIPKSLLDCLAVINGNSQSPRFRCFSEEEMEEEVECILSVSSQMKQIFWDLLPDRELDIDFSNAYMEDIEDSDDDYFDDEKHHSEFSELQLSSFDSFDSYDPVSIKDSHPTECKPCTSTTQDEGHSPLITCNRKLNGDFIMALEPDDVADMDLVEPEQIVGQGNFQVEKSEELVLEDFNFFTPSSYRNSSPLFVSTDGLLNSHSVQQGPGSDSGIHSTNHPSGKENYMPHKQSTSGNEYLVVQDVCDKTSMVAYHLIGHMLEQFAEVEGLNLHGNAVLYLRGNGSLSEDFQVAGERQNSYEEWVSESVVRQAVEGLIPLFPDGEIKGLRT